MGKLLCTVHFKHYFADLVITGDIEDIKEEPSEVITVWQEAWAHNPNAMSEHRPVRLDYLDKTVQIVYEMSELPYEVVCVDPETGKEYIWKKQGGGSYG